MVRVAAEHLKAATESEQIYEDLKNTEAMDFQQLVDKVRGGEYDDLLINQDHLTGPLRSQRQYW